MNTCCNWTSIVLLIPFHRETNKLLCGWLKAIFFDWNLLRKHWKGNEKESFLIRKRYFDILKDFQLKVYGSNTIRHSNCLRINYLTLWNLKSRLRLSLERTNQWFIDKCCNKSREKNLWHKISFNFSFVTRRGKTSDINSRMKQKARKMYKYNVMLSVFLSQIKCG